MKQFFTVLRFELNNYLKNKSFLATTILLTVLAIGIIVVPGLVMGGNSDEEDGKKGGSKEEAAVIAIWDKEESLPEPEQLGEAMGQKIEWEKCQSADAVRELVESGKAEAGFLVEDILHYTYVVENNSMSDQNDAVFSQVLASIYRNTQLAQKGLNPQEIDALYQIMPESEMEILGKDSVKNYAYTYVLIMVLYFMLVFYGQMIAVSVTTEKSNRAIEILVTSVSSNSLIFGKVLAGAIAGVLQCGLILGSAVASYHVFRESWNHKLDFLFEIPGSVWTAFIIFGLLGYLLYAFFFGMLGALVSKTEDISKTSMPITMIYIASFFIAIFGMANSDGLLMKIASFIPFTSSNAMLIRVAMGSVELWEIAAAGVLLLASCVGAGVLAAKIFRFGTLMYGNPVKFTKALKQIREK